MKIHASDMLLIYAQLAVLDSRIKTVDAKLDIVAKQLLSLETRLAILEEKLT